MGRGEWGQRGAGGRQPEEILTWLQEQGWFGRSGLKTAGMCGYVMPGVWQGNLVLPGDGKSLEVLKA